MYLEKLKITGYKNFRDEFTVQFTKGLNVLMGENGVGKTAIIDAIRLMLLEDEFGRRGISETDFHRPFEENAAAAESFRVQAHFYDIIIATILMVIVSLCVTNRLAYNLRQFYSWGE